MKSIETLVPDIYALFDNQHDWNPVPEHVSELGHRLSDIIQRRASSVSHQPTLRVSNLGTPDRKLWFTVNRPELAERLRPETKIKFLFGDILEELLLFLGKEAGHDVTGQQDEVDILGVKGHRDAVIDGRVVDVKSASTFSFNKFKANALVGNDPFGYVEQLNGYLHAGQSDPVVTEKDVGSFLVIDKTLGHICLDTYPKLDTDYEALVAHKKTVVGLPEAPEEKCYDPVPDGKSGNLKLGVQCSYCPFKNHCWSGLRTFLYSTGPVYLTSVVREPRVPEVNQDGEIITKEWS